MVRVSFMFLVMSTVIVMVNGCRYWFWLMVMVWVMVQVMVNG